MKKKSISAFSALLALLLILSSLTALTSCSSDNNTASDTSGSNTAPETEAAETQPAETTRKPLELPDKDYDGADFTFLIYPRGVAGNSHQFSEFVFFEDEAGEIINDAIGERNRLVEERFGVKIKTIDSSAVKADAQKGILAGDSSFDVSAPYMTDALALAQENLFINLYDIPNMDIENEWWDLAMNRDLSIGGKLYIQSGDILLSTKELGYFLGINMALFEQYDIENPYEAVIDGTWTTEKIHGISQKLTNDLNGDGVLNELDRFGFTHTPGSAYGMFTAAGAMAASLDKDGVPQLTLYSERNQQILDALSDLYNDKTAMLDVNVMSNTWTTNREMFINDQVAIQPASIYVLQTRRDMVSDFGILPYPKFEESQERYYHTTTPNRAMCITVPVTTPDVERTGIILEALAYESKDTTLKAYYDYNLQTKVSRDTESEQMLDIIFGDVVYDIGDIFRWGTMFTVVTESIADSSKFASLYAAAESAAKSALTSTYELYTK